MVLQRAPGAGRRLAQGQGLTVARRRELLRTARLQLRSWTLDDLAAFRDLYGRDEVIRWLGTPPRRPVTSDDEARERLERWRIREAALAPPLGLWAMVPLDDPAHRPVGTLLLLPLDDADGPTDLVEIGWHLHPDHQGRGLVTEAAAGMLAAAAQAGLPRVLAVMDLDNTRSRAVADRLGMHHDGTTDRWFGLTLRQYHLESPSRRSGATDQ